MDARGGKGLVVVRREAPKLARCDNKYQVPVLLQRHSEVSVVLLRDRGFIDVGGSLCRIHLRAGICFISQCQKKRTSCQNVLRRQHLFEIRLHVDPRFTVQWCCPGDLTPK